MSAHPASAAHEGTRRAGLFGAAMARWRALVTMPLASQTMAITGAFACSYLLYARIAGESPASGWALLAGAGSFLVLFAVLRLIDDLDDLDRDHDAERWTAAQRSARRARLRACLATSFVLLVLLNAGKVRALSVVATAAGLAWTAPFAFKRLFPRSLAVGSLLFEGAPLLIFAYGYSFWCDTGGAALHWMAPTCVVTLFWAGYEFWKFSRKAHTDAMQPYFLSPFGIRVALNAWVLLAAVVNVALADLARLSDAYAIYATMIPVAWLVGVNSEPIRAPNTPGTKWQPFWAGTTFVVALEAGLLVELLVITRPA